MRESNILFNIYNQNENDTLSDILLKILSEIIKNDIDTEGFCTNN